MLKTILASFLLWGALALTAVAADLPSKTVEPEFEEPPPIPIFSWNGVYVGVHAGAGFAHDSGVIRLPTGAGRFGLSPGGVVGGAHAGFNHTLRNLGEHYELIAGLEADIDGADAARSTSAYNNVLSARSDVRGSIRGRVGVAAARVLYFATGGLALANLDTRDRSKPALGAGNSVDMDTTVAGYTLGAGVEYAFMNSYALRAEYRTSHYGAVNSTLAAPSPMLPTLVTHRESDNRLQAGISYRFEPSSPSNSQSD